MSAPVDNTPQMSTADFLAAMQKNLEQSNYTSFKAAERDRITGAGLKSGATAKDLVR